MATTSERDILRKNYTGFCNILKHEDGLHTHLVQNGIITEDNLHDIRSKSITEKGPTLLSHISGPLEAGYTDGFYGLLEVMMNHGRADTHTFAKRIKRECQPNSTGMKNRLFL